MIDMNDLQQYRDKLLLTPAEASSILGCDPQSLRCQAKEDPDKLGFEVIVMGARVMIPRIPFYRFLGVSEE